MHFIELDHNDEKDIESLSIFINENKQKQVTFRYFNSRPFEIIKNHLVTYLATKNGEKVAYGHLDKEGDNIWLGVMVDDKFRGNGYGKLMTKKLMGYYNGKIILSVDKTNEIAINMYKSLGFTSTKEKNDVVYMERAEVNPTSKE